MRIRQIFALTVPILLVGTLAVVKGRNHTPAAMEPHGEAIAAPTHWVALTADFLRDARGQKGAVVGRYLRSSDGSDRLETGPPQEPARVVFIRNIAQSTYYSRRVGKDGSVYWISGPMTLPEDGWHPRQMTEKAGQRLLLSEEVENQRVVQTQSHGFVRLMAPGLNYLTLVNRNVITGDEERYKNVTLGEPSRDLFVPPTGAEIRQTKEIAGIKTTKLKPETEN